MPDWAAFLGITGVVLALLLLLARISTSAVEQRDREACAPTERSDARPLSSCPDGRRRDGEDDPFASPPDADARVADSTDSRVAGPADSRAVDSRTGGPAAPVIPGGREFDTVEAGGDAGRGDAAPARLPESAQEPGGAREPDHTTAGLLANVALSQGAFGALLVGAAWLTGVPASAFGVAPATVGATALAAGVGLGAALSAANEVGAAVSERVGLGRSEELRGALAPDSPRGWAALLLVVLPLIAGFEELLFRGALVGVASLGLGVSPWLLAALSSVAFALGHGAQGRAGVAVAGAFGFALAAAFVLTGSLLTVIVAHYFVNAMEFVLNELVRGE